MIKAKDLLRDKIKTLYKPTDEDILIFRKVLGWYVANRESIDIRFAPMYDFKSVKEFYEETKSWEGNAENLLEKKR